MAEHNLATDEGLRAACEELGPAENWGPNGTTWRHNLAEVLAWIRAATEAERGTREFQERLWERNHVSAVGQGTVSVDRALDDEAFRRWLAGRSLDRLPQGWQERLVFLSSFYSDLKDRLEPYLDGRVPHLKIFRVMAALFPEGMTAVASGGALQKLVKAMGSERRLDPVERHVWARERIDSLHSPIPDASAALAERMALPWVLYERFVRPKSDITEEPEVSGGGARLLPLPAARRRRGLTPIRGLFPAVLSTLE
jgi:hypothetical protein